MTNTSLRSIFFFLSIATVSMAQPTINSFNPFSANVGASITIAGTNFSSTPADNIVYFGGVRGVVTAASPTSLTVTVPAGAAYAPISVTTGNLTAWSVQPFTVTFAGGGSITANSFDPEQEFITATGATRISSADLNDDGKLDMISSNNNVSTGNTFSIHKNTTTGSTVSFDTRADFTTNLGPSYLSTGDLDGDGKLDVVVSNIGSGITPGTSVSLFRNTSLGGAISFAAKIDLTTGNYPFTNAVADLDGDGKPEILVQSNGVSVFRNTSSVGALSFAAKVDFATNIGAGNFCAADFDGDKKVDLAVYNSGPSFTTPQVSLYRNTSTPGSISFDAPIHITTSTGNHYLAAADFDLDGRLDLAVIIGSLSIYRNTGSPGNLLFETPAVVTLDAFPGNLNIGDLDGDAKPDVAITEGNPNQVSIYRNTTTGATIAFGASVKPDLNTYFNVLHMADCNGDSRPELIVINTITSPKFYLYPNLIKEPTIQSVQPLAGSFGSTVSITGTAFTDVSAVSFGGTPAASFTRVSSTSVTAVVGTGSSGSISVTTSSGTASLPGFVYTYPPSISSVAPTKGPLGSTVTISGNYFSSVAGENSVYFGPVMAVVTAATSTSLTVTVPPGAGYQPVSVSVGGFTAISAEPFNVTFPGGGSLANSLGDPAFSFNTTRDPKRVAVADLDRDGKADLLALSDQTNVISVFRNTTVSPVVSYAAFQEFTTGTSGPRSLAVGDINGDGWLDVAVAHCCNSIVSVFINNSTSGNISFQNRLNFNMTGSEIGLADIDGDGRLDLLLAGATLRVYRNTTDNNVVSFASAQSFTLGNFCTGLAVLDLDGDGKKDIASASYSDNTVSVLRNTSTLGIISFSPKQDLATGVNPYSLAAADLDGDGKFDLATPNYAAGSVGNVSLLRNTSTVGSISFAAKSDLETGVVYVIDVDAADMDGDGSPDLVVTNTASNFLLRNKSTAGTFSFDDKVTYSDFSDRVLIADVDNNGKPDLIKTKESNVLVRRNQLAEPQITSFSPSRAGTGDVITITGLNLANVTGVTFGDTPAQSFTVVSATSVTAVVGTGASGYVKVTSPEGGGFKSGFDFYNGPQVTSVLPTSGAVGSLITITGKRLGTTPAANTVRFGSTQAEVVTASATELTVKVPAGAIHAAVTVTTGGLTATASQPFTVSYAGNNTLTATLFGLKADFATEQAQDNLVAGDVDGDGKTDLVSVGIGSNTFSVFRNTGVAGTASFADKITFPTSIAPVVAALGDLDGDGKLDVAVANSASNTVSVFKNTSSTGTISFSSRIDVATATNPQGVTLADFDGDGMLDMAAANFTSSNLVSVIRNTSTPGGALSFASKIDYTAGSFPSAVAAADLNDDGKPELLVANLNASSISVFRNLSISGSLAFAPKTDFTTGSAPVSIAIGDTNNNGKPDVLVANSSSASVSFLANQSTGTSIIFSPKVDLTTNTNPLHVAIGDLSGDGKPDIAVANGEAAGKNVSVFKNTGSGFDAKFDYTSDTEPVGSVICDLDGDGLIDLASLNRGTSTVSVLRNLLSSFTSFEPATAGMGSTVTLTGTNFTGSTSVSFGGVAAASFTVVSPTSITAVVGAGNSGAVSVVTPGATLTRPGFTYMPPPAITSFVPVIGGPGSKVTITGTNFTDASAVSFGGVAATGFVLQSATTIVATVGDGASGEVAVTTPGGTALKTGFTYDPMVTAVENSLTAEGVLVFPNPAKDVIHLRLLPRHQGFNVAVDLRSADGKSVLRLEQRYNHSEGIRVENNMPTGLYLLEVAIGAERITKKVLVSR